MANDTHVRLIARREYDAARRMLGPGWAHVSSEVRRGLVFANIVGVIRGQDESIDAASVLRYLDDLCNEADRLLAD